MYLLKIKLRYVFITLFIIFMGWLLYAQEPIQAHIHSERYYQNIIAQKLNGTTEVILSDKTRIDIETTKDVIEVDFAQKWYEAVGQCAHYAFKTGKKPVIWLIKEQKYDDIHIQRCQALCNNGVGLKQNGHWIKIRLYVYDTTQPNQ